MFGLAATATIATDRAKRGEHRVAAAVKDAFGTATYALTIHKGARDRAAEEELVSLILLRAVADACGVLHRPDLPLVEGEELEVGFAPAPLLAELRSGARDAVVVRPDGMLTTTLPDSARSAELGGAPLLLSGAFNPLHEGHRDMARVAGERYGARVAFELPLENADKSSIGLVEARRRAQQFAGEAPLVLTREPLFVGKAALFPGSLFVIGADTAERILDARFYDGSQAEVERALQGVRDRGCRFLVAGREVDDRFLTLADIAIPAAQRDLFEAIPARAFRKDISSSEIRRAWAAEG